MKRVTPQMCALNLHKDEVKANNDPLQGIMPKTKVSLEHLMFSLKLNNTICSDIYNVDCRAAVKNIQNVSPRQLTAGCGSGG